MNAKNPKQRKLVLSVVVALLVLAYGSILHDAFVLGKVRASMYCLEKKKSYFLYLRFIAQCADHVIIVVPHIDRTLFRCV